MPLIADVMRVVTLASFRPSDDCRLQLCKCVLVLFVFPLEDLKSILALFWGLRCQRPAHAVGVPCPCVRRNVDRELLPLVRAYPNLHNRCEEHRQRTQRARPMLEVLRARSFFGGIMGGRVPVSCSDLRLSSSAETQRT